MKKKILLLAAIPLFFLASYIYSHPDLACAFSTRSACQPPLNRFSTGSTSFQIKFPPGGGTTCDNIASCPKISLPVKGTVYSIKVDMALTDPALEIGTPYIWVPMSGSNEIAQIDTKTATEVQRYAVGTNPSRTFVIPGGDTWVANRDSNDVTKLSPLTGNGPDATANGTCGDGSCGTDETLYSCKTDCTGLKCGPLGTIDCRLYQVVGSYATGGGPRGVTGDTNGDVWVGNYTDGNIVKLKPTNPPKTLYAIDQTVNVGGNPYGLIADPFGYVWVSNRGTSSVQAVNINTGLITQSTAIPGPYGIGMNNDGDILVASCCGTPDRAYIINGYGSGSPGTIKASPALAGGVSTRGRGIAADLNGAIWVGSDNGPGLGTIYSFKSDGSGPYCSFYNAGHDTVGVAIDFDNNVWAVPYDGNVLKLTHGGSSPCTVTPAAPSLFLGPGPYPPNLLYNYSDMTGLRTVPKSISLAGFKVPLSDTGTFDICTDGTGTCTDPGPCAPVSAILSTCIPNYMNTCDISLKIFSMQSGEYTLSNLQVIYGSEDPVTTGGLVSCGRKWDDPKTPIREDAPCDLCHIIYLANLVMNYLMSFVGIISVLALIIVGYLFITSAGDPQKRKDAKNRLKWVLVGFVIVFLAWLIVDFLFAVWGYLDPMGGKWFVVCDK
ncbi:MAG: hypothetical protein WC788_05655 [Candidatus Paceibacterota bacterium]|jgi:streptogramin lyase